MAEEKEEISITVIRRRDVVTYPKIAMPVINVLVTYVAAGLPPSTVIIPKKEYTLDLEKQLLKQDIQRRLKIVPETYRV